MEARKGADIYSLDFAVNFASFDNLEYVQGYEEGWWRQGSIVVSTSLLISYSNVFVYSCRAQCGQIFIGMVAMNYQAKSDVVALIENLDHACIRFVHFSRDQELRSRVSIQRQGLSPVYVFIFSQDR